MVLCNKKKLGHSPRNLERSIMLCPIHKPTSDYETKRISSFQTDGICSKPKPNDCTIHTQICGRLLIERSHVGSNV